MKNRNIITALDIGTTKICAIIAEVTENNKLEVLGIGKSKSIGLEKGIVKSINDAAESIRKALSEAEREAGIKAENIFAGIAGEHIKSQNAIGKISLTGVHGQDPKEISKVDVEQVINEAKGNVRAQLGNQNLEIIHGIAQQYDIDDQKGIANPVNMSGFQLTAHVHVVMANVSSLKNIQRCIQHADYNVRDIVLEPVASARAVLNEDELNLGCILVDIGGGTTDVAIFHRGSIRFSKVKPIGGSNVTQDLAIGLRTPLKSAEKIKVKYGTAVADRVNDDELVDIIGIGGRDATQKKRKFISEIIEYRMRETLDLAYKNVINNYHQDLMTAGLILTGGASLLKGIDELAYEVFNMPVKIGYPDLDCLTNHIPDLHDPRFSTTIGLLYYGLDEIPDSSYKGVRNSSNFGKKITNSLNKLMKYITDNL